jgi:hypothetical protein
MNQPQETPSQPELRLGRDIVYLENGAVKQVVPVHPETNPHLLMSAVCTLGEMVTNLMPHSNKAWTVLMLEEVAKELNVSRRVLTEMLLEIRRRQNDEIAAQSHPGEDGPEGPQDHSPEDGAGD